MIKIDFYKPENFSELNYDLDEVQIKFTATVKFALERISQRISNQDFSSKPITIFDDEKPVGFFVLDFGHDKLELSDNEKCVLIRALSIDPKFQGKGIGKNAMSQIPEFLEQNFPETDEIVLAVNHKNENAYHLYLKSGYVYDGKTREGRSGLQYLMYKKL